MRDNRRKHINIGYGFLRIFAFILICVMIIGTIPVSAASKKKVTVTNKTKLLAELKKSGSKTIVFSSKTKKSITIPAIKGTEKKTLVIDAKNAKIVNKSIFKGITIKNCNSFTEKGKGNKITITGDKVKLIVSKNAKVSVYFTKKATLTITGSKKADIDLEISAKGSTVIAEAPVKVIAKANATINLKKGSEGSEVAYASNVNAKINNTSTKEPTVKVDGKVSGGTIVNTTGKTDDAGKTDNFDKPDNTNNSNNTNSDNNSGSVGNADTVNTSSNNTGTSSTGSTDPGSLGIVISGEVGNPTPVPTPYLDNENGNSNIVDIPIPTSEVSDTPIPTDEVVDALTPTEEVSDTQMPTEEVVDTPTPTEEVIDTPTPTEEVIDTPTPTEEVIDTPTPTEEVIDTPTPIEEVINTPTPTESIGRPYTTKILAQFNQTEARTMLDKINDLRASLNDEDVEPLVIDYDLEKVAMQRAAEIAVKFGTTRPDGASAEQTLVEYGFSPTSRYNIFAEMICMGDQDTVDLDAAFTYFASTTKYRISLTGYYYSVGIGHVRIDETDFWVIELYNKSKNLEFTNPVDGEVYFPMNIPDSLLSSVTANYVSGATSISVGSSVVAPVYIPKARFVGSEMDVITLAPIDFQSEDDYVIAINGMISGKKAGTGTISANVLGKTVSVNIEVIG